MAWMKILGNFQSGKGTQERSTIERFLVGHSEGQQFYPEVVHAVLSVIHELVYCTIHCHIHLKKSTSTSLRNSCLAVESDDTLFSTSPNDNAKMNRGRVPSEQRPIMEKEMDVLNALVMKDKSSISSSLKNLDEGNSIFPGWSFSRF